MKHIKIIRISDEIIKQLDHLFKAKNSVLLQKYSIVIDKKPTGKPLCLKHARIIFDWLDSVQDDLLDMESYDKPSKPTRRTLKKKDK